MDVLSLWKQPQARSVKVYHTLPYIDSRRQVRATFVTKSYFPTIAKWGVCTYFSYSFVVLVFFVWEMIGLHCWNCHDNVPWRSLHLGYGCIITLKATTAPISDFLPYLPYIALRVSECFSTITGMACSDRDMMYDINVFGWFWPYGASVKEQLCIKCD